MALDLSHSDLPIALVSALAGRAIVRIGSAYFLLTTDNDAPEPCHERQWAYLKALHPDASLLRADSYPFTDVRAQLEHGWRKDRAQRMALVVLDATYPASLRRRAAEASADLLYGQDVHEHVHSVLMGIDEKIDFEGGAKLAARVGATGLALLLRRVAHDRPEGSVSAYPLMWGKYEIIDRVASGGLGTVFRARDTSSGLIVALKTLREAPGVSSTLFFREVRAMTGIRHDGVLSILDFGTHEGHPWLATEFILGGTVRTLLSRLWGESTTARATTEELPSAFRSQIAETQAFSSEFPADVVPFGDEPVGADPPIVRRSRFMRRTAGAGSLAMVTRLAIKVCEALQHVHEQGVVHRDVKPDNILLRNDELPVLADFGLSSRQASGSGREILQIMPQFSGTPAYMSPEQIRGEHVDARSDLYSFGCMLYELVVGRPPFLGDTAEVVRQHLSVTPRSPSEFVDDVPPTLDHLIRRLLAKDKNLRVRSAEDARSHLATLLDGSIPPSFAAIPQVYPGTFIGRNEELARLRLAADRGGVVVIAGEAGIGKTRLLAEWLRHKPRGEVIASACVAGDSPAAPLLPLLRRVAELHAKGDLVVSDSLLGVCQRALESFERDLLAVMPPSRVAVAASRIDPAKRRLRLLGALRETLIQLARVQRVVLVFDDAQWMDELSMAFLQSLVSQEREALPLLIVAACRSDDDAGWLQEWQTRVDARTVILGPLKHSETLAMATQMLGDDDATRQVAARVVDHAGGNPFFVSELLRHALGSGLATLDSAGRFEVPDEVMLANTLSVPQSLSTLIERRFSAISDVGRTVAGALAILGQRAALKRLCTITDLPYLEVKSALEELLRRALVETDESDHYRFVHNVLQRHAIRRLSSRERRRLEKRARATLKGDW